MAQAARGDMAALRAVPKADLHCHAALSAPWSCYQELSTTPLAAVPQCFSNFNEFQQCIRQTFFPLLKSPHAMPKVLDDMLTHMQSDGVVYTEASFDISLAFAAGVTWGHLAQALKRVQMAHPGIVVWPELGVARDVPPEFWQGQLTQALETGFFKEWIFTAMSLLRDPPALSSFLRRRASVA